TLVTQLPIHDRALVGNQAILRYLHDTLLLRRCNGGPLTWRMVLRWRTRAGFPLLRGFTARHHATPALTTSFALTACTLAQFSPGGYDQLLVCSADALLPREGSSGFARAAA